jgi:signal transduction histidine kinase/response regulator RpfG family c-di-GMP phosphodiesterase
MRFFRFIKKELLYAGLSKEEFELVREPVNERNRKSITSWSCGWGLFWFTSLFLFSAPEYAKPWVVFLISFFISIITALVASLLIKRYKWLLFPTMYLYVLTVFGTGIGLSVTQPDKRIATVMAVATITPTFFIDRTIATICTEITAIIIYVVLGKLFIDPEVFSWGLETLILFSFAGIFSGHIINKSRFERFVYADSAERLAEIADSANEAKSRFLANISHEIRTPINAVLGMDEMILRECDDPEIVNYAENIKTAGNTLRGLINDILDFSKIEAGRMEIIPVDYDLSSVINDLVNMVATRADDKGLELKLNIDNDIPKFLNGDEVRVKQIITNILTNAVKYTEKGSVTFTIGYERSEKETDCVILKVSVKDTGIGIREEDMEKLFAKFERIEEERNRKIEGTGLGMSITRSLLEMMGSTLKVDSVYGEGSDFHFDIKQKVVRWDVIGDYEASYKEHISKHEKYKESFIAPDARILVVDDNPMNLVVFKSLIKQTQIKIDTAEDGDIGIHLSRDVLYDIIFIDHLMPGKDGIEVLHQIKSEPSNPNLNTPYICLTANAISGAKEQYLKEGFDDYIAKPIDPLDLEEMLIRLLPDEKITKTAQNRSDKSKVVIKDDLEFLKGQSIIDVDSGIKNNGSKEAYLSTLQMVYEECGRSLEEIDRFYSERDMKNYTIKIHALKSTARIIGAIGIGEDAQALENAGKEMDIGYIDEHHEAFMEKYKLLKKLLKPKFELEPEQISQNKGKPEADPSLMKSVFVELLSAAGKSDREMIMSIFKEMEEFCIPTEYKGLYGNLKTAAENSEYDTIKDLLNTAVIIDAKKEVHR